MKREAAPAAARAFRFGSGSTTDDHDLHVVGITTRAGRDWFLVKDSWSSSWNNDHPGYCFFHEDYVKLKTLAFLVHRDAVRELLARARPRRPGGQARRIGEAGAARWCGAPPAPWNTAFTNGEGPR